MEIPSFRRTSLITVVLSRPIPWPVWCLIIIAAAGVAVLYVSPELRKRIFEAPLVETKVMEQKAPDKKAQEKVAVAPPKKTDEVVVPKEKPPEKKVTTHDATKVYGLEKSLPWKHTWLLEYGGRYEDAGSAIKMMRSSGVVLSDSAVKTLYKYMSGYVPSVSARVVQITVAELGFPNGADFGDIVKRAKARGLRTFPIDAIPAAAATFTGSRRKFFGVEVEAQKYVHDAALVAGKTESGTSLTLSEWFRLRSDVTFDRAAIFLFVVPE